MFRWMLLTMLGLMVAGWAAEGDLPQPDPVPALSAEDLARAQAALEAIGKAEDDSQGTVDPENLVALAAVAKLLDDCEAYLQVGQGGNAGTSFLTARAALGRLDDAVREQAPTRVAQLERRLDLIARRLLVSEGLEPGPVMSPPEPEGGDTGPAASPAPSPEERLPVVAPDATGETSEDASETRQPAPSHAP